MNDWADIISLSAELAPAAGTVLLAALTLWLLWRGVGRLLRAFGSKPQASQGTSPRDQHRERREPTLEPAAPQTSTALDTSEILALKASIDALTQQVADLSRKLAASEVRLTAGSRPTPIVMNREEIAVSVDPSATLGRGRGNQSLTLTEKTS